MLLYNYTQYVYSMDGKTVSNERLPKFCLIQNVKTAQHRKVANVCLSMGGKNSVLVRLSKMTFCYRYKPVCKGRTIFRWQIGLIIQAERSSHRIREYCIEDLVCNTGKRDELIFLRSSDEDTPARERSAIE